MRKSRPLTELEGTVLGVVWVQQPCTPYQVRRQFTDSPSPHWSGSAGAIYPLMTRLETGGLLRSRSHATGSRKSRRYALTPAGRTALQTWVGPPLAADVVGLPPDPLRTRIAFLSVLPAARRRRFLTEMEERLRDFLEIAERVQREGRGAGPYFQLMARGATAMQKTRLDWLRSVTAALSNGGMGSGPPKRSR